ncbi:MAG: ABC-type transport system involved in cytochrome bd biosynthesis fused ATPase/permease subunit [Flavobacteriaceae bacterium]|jgi:ABC-type transport system involved in cytochrome bd biosynthesis fused ATPase/permease subunit
MQLKITIMSKEHTDLKILVKGLKTLAASLPLLFLGPYFITLSALNKENWTFYLFLVLGLVAGASAIFLIFKGIQTIMKSIF